MDDPGKIIIGASMGMIGWYFYKYFFFKLELFSLSLQPRAQLTTSFISKVLLMKHNN